MMMPGMLRDAMAANPPAVRTGHTAAAPAAMPAGADRPLPRIAAAAGCGGAVRPADSTSRISPRRSADPRVLVRSVVQAGGYTLQEAGRRCGKSRFPSASCASKWCAFNSAKKMTAGTTSSPTLRPADRSTKRTLPPCLRYNTKTVYAAFAVQAGSAGEQLGAAHQSIGGDPRSAVGEPSDRRRRLAGRSGRRETARQRRELTVTDSRSPGLPDSA